jgi:hypothetical protein
MVLLKLTIYLGVLIFFNVVNGSEDDIDDLKKIGEFGMIFFLFLINWDKIREVKNLKPFETFLDFLKRFAKQFGRVYKFFNHSKI